MEGKLCVTKVDQEYIEGVFVSPKREEQVRIKREMINMPITPGNVLRIDYSWTAVSVFEILGESFYPVEAIVKERSKISHVQIADSQEEANALFKKRLASDFELIKKASDENFEFVGLEVE